MIRILSIIALLCACAHPHEKLTFFSGMEMTIDYRILIGHPLSLSEKNSISEIIHETFDEVNRLYNKWNPDSELSRLNNLKADIKVDLSKNLERLLILTDKIVSLTGGRFDPTIEPIQIIWKNYLEQKKTPPQAEITSVVQAIGWDKVHYENGQFYKDHDATQMDLGGIAKGYCVDLLVTRLNQAGFENVYVEWGGEIRASGEHPDKRPWNIYISRLNNTNPQDAIDLVSLCNQAIATSGELSANCRLLEDETTFEKITYFHIIDPTTLRPLIATPQSVAVPVVF